MPSASVSTAITANAGDLRKLRNAKRMSCNMLVIGSPEADQLMI
jgi:hypothetical protein